MNGERTLIRGWNWVPIDALYGVPRRDKLERLLGLAADANVNLLRVWGGGADRDPASSTRSATGSGCSSGRSSASRAPGIESVPARDPDFVRTLVDDARQIVPRLRQHPSLAIWCGGNELDADDSHPVLAGLRDVVHELDPGRAWLPTSPLGGDVHGPWEHQGLAAHTARYDDATARLYSEFGVEGMTNRSAHEQLVEEEHRWPADRSNPVYEHLGAWWNNAPLVQECFGNRIDDLETLRRASQWLQYEGLRYAVEATLRRGCGTIPWQFNESFPNAWCTSAARLARSSRSPPTGASGARTAGAPSAQFDDVGVGRSRRGPRASDSAGASASTWTGASSPKTRARSPRRSTRSRTTSSCSTSAGRTAT